MPSVTDATLMPLRFGLQLTAVHSKDVPAGMQLAEHEELVELAEHYGFDFIAVGQHFLTPELRYYQPVPYLAHLATVGRSLRVATGIILLPLHNPVDIAEQIATLDVVTGGRAIFGVGIGYADHEFQAFGVDRADRVGRFEEAIEIIRQLWSGISGRYQGKHFTIDPLATGALPLQRPGPPIWSAGQTGVAVRRAARTADSWYVPPFVTHAELSDLRQHYNEERERLGKPFPDEFPVRRDVVIADSRGGRHWRRRPGREPVRDLPRVGARPGSPVGKLRECRPGLPPGAFHRRNA